MTDPLEQALRRAAQHAGTSTPVPPLAALRKKAHRGRAALVAVPVAVALVVAGTAVGLSTGDRDSVTTQLGQDNTTNSSVIFEVIPPHSAAGNGLENSVRRCLNLPGVVTAEQGLPDFLSRRTVEVRGDDNALAFEQCIESLADFETRRSDAPAQAALVRARWDAAGSQDYTYTLRQQCFCAVQLTYKITVVDGKAVRADALQAADPRRAEGLRLSIDDLFNLIERPPAGTASVRAKYDPTRTIPTRIDVDMRVDTIDDEYTYLIKDYRPTQHQALSTTPATPAPQPSRGAITPPGPTASP